jgi:colicin import membrane protein
LKRQQEELEAERRREEQRLAELKRQQEEAERRRQAEAERQAREQARREEAMRLLRENLEAEQRSRMQAALIGQYTDGIRQAVQRVWRLPPGAPRDLKVTLRIELLPDGTVNAVAVDSSSGNEPFDRSAVAAVRKVGVFRVPDDPVLFSRFRNMRLEFSPEDFL